MRRSRTRQPAFVGTEPTRDPEVDGLTLENALATQGLTLKNAKRHACRTKLVCKDDEVLFSGSHMDIWKWLWLRTYGYWEQAHKRHLALMFKESS